MDVHVRDCGTRGGKLIGYHRDNNIMNFNLASKENVVRNIDVRVNVDVRVDPAGVILLLASTAMALFFFKKQKAEAKALQA